MLKLYFFEHRINKVKSLNANLYLTDPHNAFKEVENTSKVEGYYFIHPFDGKFTIQGTASLGFEICKQIESIDNIIYTNKFDCDVNIFAEM